MTDELDKALAEPFAWADGSDDWLGWMSRRSNTMCHAEKVDEWKAVAIKGFAHCKTLAAAVRELRETVKAREEEIARMKLSWDSAESQIDDVDAELRDVVKENAALCKKLHEAGINPSLDAALNEGDGIYRP